MQLFLSFLCFCGHQIGVMVPGVPSRVRDVEPGDKYGGMTRTMHRKIRKY